MKRWEYSKGWKALALILNQVCAVVLVLSIAVCMVSVGNNGFRLFKEDPYQTRGRRPLLQADGSAELVFGWLHIQYPFENYL